MLYDNGSTTQQLSKNEQNARDSQELGALKEAARANSEQRERENIAVAAKTEGEQSLLSRLSAALFQRDQRAVEAPQSAFLGSTQALATQQGQEQAGYEREQNFENLKRFDRMFGDGEGLSEIEINNVEALMNSSKGWSDTEIRDMALNNKVRR